MHIYIYIYVRVAYKTHQFSALAPNEQTAKTSNGTRHSFSYSLLYCSRRSYFYESS